MSLIVPPFAFAHCTTNTATDPPSSAACAGTAFSTNGTINVESATTSAISALTHDCHYIVIGVCGHNSSTANAKGCIDIMVDPAGGTSWSELIADLAFGHTADVVAGTNLFQRYYHFPLYIKSGSSLGFRNRVLVDTSSGPFIGIWCYGEPSRPDMWWCGQKVETLGISGLTNYGVNVTPGATGAWGSWTNIGASTQPYGSVQLGIHGSDGAVLAQGYFWEIGYGSTALPGAPRVYTAGSTLEYFAASCLNEYPIWCDVPASTTWQVRGAASGTGEIYSFSIYGVY